MSERFKEEGIVTLTCGGGDCCPTVDFTNPEKVVIKDDFGGQVELTQKQWGDMKARFSSKG
jgi:hypothetical protein